MDVTCTAVADILKELRKIYNHPDRTYHNIDHIELMLAQLNECRYITEHPDRIALVIWFHDAVYDPERHDNELKSAELWSLKMRCHLNEGAVDWGNRAILATINHLPMAMIDNDIQVLIDLDLTGLGASWEVFQKNTQNIRLEYKHASDEEFRLGRKDFFKRFLSRKQIYGTEYWHERLEAKARENMERAIDA